MTSVTRRDALLAAAAAGTGLLLAEGEMADRASAQPAPSPSTPTLTLLLVNDIYQMSGVNGRGGFSRLAAIVRAERAKATPVLYAHAGDMFSPSLMSGFDQGAHTVELLNVMPPDVFVPGNHEFDFGPAVYAKRRAELKFAYFAANLRGADGKPLPAHQDRRMFEFGGIKVGVFGVALAQTPLMSQSGDLKFLGELETVAAQSKALRDEGADLVVCVAHTDFQRDLEIMRSRLVDVLLSGHDHDLRLVYDNRVVMAESGEEGEFVTAIDIHAKVGEKDGKRSVSWNPSFRIIDSSTVAPDPEAQAIVTRLETELGRELDVAIGTAAVDLDTRSATVRSQETPFGNLVADAIRESTGANVSITNGGSIRGNTTYAAGRTITRRDVLKELPFGNRTVMVEITGSDLLAAVENGVSEIDKRVGRFPHVSGMRIVVNEKAPPGSRVVLLEVAGKPVKRSTRYKVASNDFLLGGGDGYASLAHGRTLIGKTDGKLLANVVMAHIRALGAAGGPVEKRVVLK